MLEIIRIFQDEDDREALQDLVDYLINLAMTARAKEGEKSKCCESSRSVGDAH